MVQEVRTQEGVMGGDVLIDELELLLDRVQPARRRRRESGVGGRRGARGRSNPGANHPAKSQGGGQVCSLRR